MTRPQTILCPVDFSECSRRALDHALGLARCYGSTVTALHVVSPVPVAVPPAYPALPPQVEPAFDREAVAAQIWRLVEAERVPGARVEVQVEEAPAVAAEILAQASRLRSDLIVIGTHGRSGFERFFLGSTAEKVLRRASCPVMTVPPKAPDVVPRGPAPFARILCPIDFSLSSERALEYAMSLAQEAKGALVLLHAIEVLPLYYDFAPPAVVDVDAWTNEAMRRLRLMVPDAVRSSCDVREMVARGKAYREILAAADTLDADLIVMGVQGRGAADLLVFGSTTHHVVRQAHCAVLTLRPVGPISDLPA